MEWIILAILVLGVVVWIIATYNRFVSLRQHLRESWSDVDVELKRRYELIPNLVQTVKGYAAHEREVFESVTRARQAAMGNTGNPARQSGDEARLVRELGRLLAVGEAYPDLRASRGFLDLQEELSATEDRIAAARRFFNGNVRELNTLRESFPSSLIAAATGVRAAGFFEIPDHSERSAPPVTLTSPP